MVITRKVGFGSQADTGPHTRGILMAVLHPLQKRQMDEGAQLTEILDYLATITHHNSLPLLFRSGPTCE
jgi:hypothetical protein